MKKILLVGLGSIGRRHLRNTRELLPDSEILVYRQHTKGDSTPPEGADGIVYNLEEALEFKPDAVIISTPASEHIKNAIDFLKNGAHLFIEKPLAMNSVEATELVTVAEEHNKFLMVGYVLRFQPIVGFLKEVIASDKLGKTITARVEVGQYLPDWRPSSDYREGVSAQRKLGGGVLLELSHELDYSTWLFGFPKSVICSCEKLSDLEIDVEDSATVIMEYDKKKVVVSLDFLQRTAHMSVKVVGSEGTLNADLIKETASITYINDETEELNTPALAAGNDMYLRQFDLFFSKSFEDYSNKFEDMKNYEEYVSVERGAKVMKLVDISRESNEKGSRLPFNGELDV